MTITLDVVHSILGLRVTGTSISFNAVKARMEAFVLVHDFLGVTIDDAKSELSSKRGQSVRLEWLREKFSVVSDTDGEARILCCAREYLLYILGCTLFADKSGSRVSICYLYCLKDVRKTATFAWGTATLAYLYRNLGQECKHDDRQMASYLTLLHAWVSEHFPMFMLSQSMLYTEDLPRVFRWSTRIEHGVTADALQTMREQIDALSPRKVVWNPYADSRRHHPFLEVTFFTGLLRCFDDIEPYHPERVLRQFGLVQMVPDLPTTRGFSSRKGNISSRCVNDYQYIDIMWCGWSNHLLSNARRSVHVIRPWDCTSDYMEYYRRISHPFVQNKEHRSSTFPTHPLDEETDAHCCTSSSRILAALSIAEPVMQRGRNNTHNDGLYNCIFQMTQVLGGVDEHSTESLSQHAHRAYSRRCLDPNL